MTIHYDIETDGLYLEGIEKGISLKERDFTLKLWALQEFPLEKIASLVSLTEEQVADIILVQIQEQGKTKEDALEVLDVYRLKFPTASKRAE